MGDPAHLGSGGVTRVLEVTGYPLVRSSFFAVSGSNVEVFR